LEKDQQLKMQDTMYRKTNRKGVLMSNALCHIFCLIVAILIPIDAYAKSASEVFEIASKSTVVVLGYDAKGKASSLGSGVVMPDGSVATNCHVIEKATRLAVRYQKREYSAIKRYTDLDRDACTLNVIDLIAPAIRPGTTRGLKVGMRVYTIGAPQGLELTLSEGIVSSLREIDSGQYIQTTAPISPGSSGGGLFDEEGRLIGLTSFFLAKGQNLNFALPVEWISELPKRHEQTALKKTRTVEWVAKAVELDAKRNWRELIAHSQRWTASEPKNAIAWGFLGIAYNESGQTIKAIDSYQQALRINPENSATWYNLSLAYDKSGQTIKKIECLQKTVQINSEHANAWYNLGTTYGQSGQTSKAIECLNQVVRINPDYYTAWVNLGVAYGHLGQNAKAIDCFQQALRINPKHANALYNIGISYKIDGQKKAVIEVFQKLKHLDPKLADKFFNEIVMD
jgi:cytochrome c-type biogenesis protein CcmH/NrfG